MQQSFQQTHEIFEKLKKVNIYHLNSSRRYMAEILPIRRKTLSHPSISIVKNTCGWKPIYHELNSYICTRKTKIKLQVPRELCSSIQNWRHFLMNFFLFLGVFRQTVDSPADGWRRGIVSYRKQKESPTRQDIEGSLFWFSHFSSPEPKAFLITICPLSVVVVVVVVNLSHRTTGSISTKFGTKHP